MARDRAGAKMTGRAALLLGSALLAGCEGADFAPFGRSGSAAPPDSLTVRRVMGDEMEAPPLLPEPGNVWPDAEAPRATLANPDGVDPALAGRPGTRGREPGLGLSPEGTPGARAPLNRRGSSTPPGVLEPLDPVPLPRQGVAAGAPPIPPAPRLEGRVIPLPGGSPAVVSGGTDRVQSFTVPGGGTGTAINDGRTTTLIGPDGRVTVVPR